MELYLIWLPIQKMHCGSGCVIKPNTSAQFNLPISKLVVCVREKFFLKELIMDYIA